MSQVALSPLTKNDKYHDTRLQIAKILPTISLILRTFFGRPTRNTKIPKQYCTYHEASFAQNHRRRVINNGPGILKYVKVSSLYHRITAVCDGHKWCAT